MSNEIFEILPNGIKTVITELLNPVKITELRLRSDKPVMLNYGGKRKYIAKNGLVDDANGAMTVSAQEIRDVVMAAGEYSLYAVNDEIVRGYITIGGGVRMGICGNAVYDNGCISTVKDFSSLTIRFPHEITGCGGRVYDAMKKIGRYSALVLSPPGCGKTTMLRDLARLIASDSPCRNVLIVDEREEIAASKQGENLLNVGNNVDIMSNCGKAYAFENGVRSMCPDVIITDELYSVCDVDYIREATGSGVDVIASAHAGSIEGFARRALGKLITEEKMFDMYVVLSFRHGVGTIEQILDRDLNAADYGG